MRCEIARPVFGMVVQLEGIEKGPAGTGFQPPSQRYLPNDWKLSKTTGDGSHARKSETVTIPPGTQVPPTSQTSLKPACG